MNSEQFMGLLRALLAASGPLAALLVQIGLPQDKAKAWLDIASALATILTPALAAWWSSRAHSDAAKVAAVTAMPGVAVTVNPTVAPAAAVAAANDPQQPKVTTTLLALFAVGAFLLVGAGGLTACSSAPATTPAEAQKVQVTLDKIQTAYTTATVGVALLCAFNASVYPCNDADAMAKVTAAKMTLDVVFAKARDDVALATTADAMTVAEKAALDAIGAYAKAVSALGVKPAPAG